MYRLQVDVSVLVDFGAAELSQASCAISAAITSGKPVAEWLEPIWLAAIFTALGLEVDLETGNLIHASGGSVNLLGVGLKEHKFR